MFGTYRFGAYITPICLFCTYHYICFFGDFWCVVRTLGHIHCTQISEFFVFICYCFEFHIQPGASTPGLEMPCPLDEPIRLVNQIIQIEKV
jgi:hypothetical protein